MDGEQILKLFDICWFYNRSFENPPPSSSSSSSAADSAPLKDETQIENPSVCHLRSLLRRSLSGEPSSRPDSLSPNSVLSTPKLETIFSRKESGQEIVQLAERPSAKKATDGRKRKCSRSLSDLEFEELKGFLDLGFTFSDVDMDSRLVSIVPGLQRLGKKGEPVDESAVCRPYLSEAWIVDGKEEDPLMNLRIPAVDDETGMKDQLRHWAHAVASTVR